MKIIPTTAEECERIRDHGTPEHPNGYPKNHPEYAKITEQAEKLKKSENN